MSHDYLGNDEFIDYFTSLKGDRTGAIEEFVRDNNRLVLNIPRLGTARQISSSLREGSFSDYYEFEKMLARRLHPLLAAMNLNIISDLLVNSLFAEKYGRYARDINYVLAGNLKPGLADFKKVILSMVARDGHYMAVKFYDLELRRLDRDLYMALKPVELAVIQMKKSLVGDDEKNASMVLAAFKSFMKRHGERVAAMLLTRMEWDDDLRKYIPFLNDTMELPAGPPGDDGVDVDAAGGFGGATPVPEQEVSRTGADSPSSGESARRKKINSYAGMIRRNYLDAVADDDETGIRNIVTGLIIKNERVMGEDQARKAVTEILELWLDDESISEDKRRVLVRIAEKLAVRDPGGTDAAGSDAGPAEKTGRDEGTELFKDEEAVAEPDTEVETKETDVEVEIDETDAAGNRESADADQDESVHAADRSFDDMQIDDDILDSIPDGAPALAGTIREDGMEPGDGASAPTGRDEVMEDEILHDDEFITMEADMPAAKPAPGAAVEEEADYAEPGTPEEIEKTMADEPRHDADAGSEHDGALAALLGNDTGDEGEEFLIPAAQRGDAADHDHDDGFLIADRQDVEPGRYEIKEKTEESEKHFTIKDIRPVDEEGAPRTVREDENDEAPGTFAITDDLPAEAGSYDIKEKIDNSGRHFAIKDIEPVEEQDLFDARGEWPDMSHGAGSGESSGEAVETADMSGIEDLPVRDEVLFEDRALTRKYKLEERARNRATKEGREMAEIDAGTEESRRMEQFIENIGTSDSVQDVNEAIHESGMPEEVVEVLHRVIGSDGFDDAFEYITQSGEFNYRVKIVLLEKWLKVAGEKRGWFEADREARMGKIDRMIKFYMNILTGSRNPEKKKQLVDDAGFPEKKRAAKKIESHDEGTEEEDENAPLEKRILRKIQSIIKTYADSIDVMDPFYRKVIPRLPGEIRQDVEEQVAAVREMKDSLVKRTAAMIKSKKPDPTVIEDLNASSVTQQYIWSETIAGKGKGASLEDLFRVFEHDKDFHREIDRILKIIKINNKNNLLKNMLRAEHALIIEFTAALNRERLRALWTKTQHRQNKDKLKLVRDLIELIGDIDQAGNDAPGASAPGASAMGKDKRSAAAVPVPRDAGGPDDAPDDEQFAQTLDEFQKLYRSERHRRLAEKRVPPIREFFIRLAGGEEGAVRFAVSRKKQFVEFLRFINDYSELKDALEILPAVRYCKKERIL